MLLTAPRSGGPVRPRSAPARPRALLALLFVLSCLLGGALPSGASASSPLAPVPDVYFSGVKAGTTETQTITLTNTSSYKVSLGPAAPSLPFSLGEDWPGDLAPGEQRQVSVSYSPTRQGNNFGLIAIYASDNRGIGGDAGNSYVYLYGQSYENDPTTTAPTTVDFGEVSVGQTATSQIATTLADASRDVVVTRPLASGPFQFSGDDDIALGPGHAGRTVASFGVSFMPTAPGPFSEQVTVTVKDEATGTEFPTKVTLKGAGIAPTTPSSPTVSVDKASVNYGYQRPGSHPCPVTVKNTGNATVFFDQVSVGDDQPDPRRVAVASQASVFSVQGSTLPLEPGDSRTFIVYFDPTDPVQYDDVLRIYSNAEGSPLDIPLTGKGQIGKLTGAPSSLALSDAAVGAKVSKTITVKNTGTFATTLSTSITGSGASRFSVSGSTSSLAINGTRSFTVTFSPTARGTQSASLVIGGDAVNAPVTVPLSGRGVGPVATLSASSLAYGSVKLGASSSKTITVKNTGETALTFASAPKITGADAARFTVSGSTATLAAGASRTFTVTFKPTAKKANTASVTFATNASPAAPAVALSGTGS